MSAKKNAMSISGSISEQLDNLSARDRTLLLGLVGFMMIVATGLLFFVLRSQLDNKAAQVLAAKNDLQTLTVMQEAYLSAAVEAKQTEARLRKHKSQAVDAFIEKIASDTDVRDVLSAVNQQSSEAMGNIRQTQHKVQLKKSSLEGVVNFIHALETSGFPLKIDNAHLKTVFFKGEKTLDLTLELTSYALEEEA